ncbi:MAG: hypothetical protein ACR2RE_13550, partial [Geminicoccaceae bacterium]
MTFGNELKSFALAADNVDGGHFDRILKMCREYLHKNFGIVNIDILAESIVNDNAGLAPIITAGQHYHSYQLHNSEGDPNGICSYCFLTGNPLWAIAQDTERGTLINDDRDLVDLWSSTKNLPNAFGVISDRCKTMIAIPIKERRTIKAVIYFESEELLRPSNNVKTELILMSDSLHIINTLANALRSRSSNTDSALDSLDDSVKKYKIFDTLIPSIFISYSSDADDKIIGIIRSSLGDYHQLVRPIFWEDITKSGEINQHVLDAISSSKGAICYFSEPAHRDLDDGILYNDNSNVLFEAGLIHAFTSNETVGPISWIPIREHASDPAPFDFRNLRFLEIPRLPDGGLNTNAFEADFRDRIESFLIHDLKISIELEA